MGFLSESGRTARAGLALGIVVLALGGLAGAGCGGSDDDTSTSEAPATGTTSTDAGAAADPNEAAVALFDSSGCAGCHTLSAAGSDGAVGPNLDVTSLSTAEIEAKIRSGGGAMPPYEGQLSDAEITSLAGLISNQ
jgi:mono/diheme cytochrome c family protein